MTKRHTQTKKHTLYDSLPKYPELFSKSLNLVLRRRQQARTFALMLNAIRSDSDSIGHLSHNILVCVKVMFWSKVSITTHLNSLWNYILIWFKKGIEYKFEFLFCESSLILKTSCCKMLMQLHLTLHQYRYNFFLRITALSTINVCKNFPLLEIHSLTKRNTFDIPSDWAWCSFLWVSAPILRGEDISFFFTSTQ